MNTTLITSLLTSVLPTLTMILGSVDKAPGFHEVAEKINESIISITGALNILTLPK